MIYVFRGDQKLKRRQGGETTAVIWSWKGLFFFKHRCSYRHKCGKKFVSYVILGSVPLEQVYSIISLHQLKPSEWMWEAEIKETHQICVCMHIPHQCLTTGVGVFTSQQLNSSIKYINKIIGFRKEMSSRIDSFDKIFQGGAWEGHSLTLLVPAWLKQPLAL